MPLNLKKKSVRAVIEYMRAVPDVDKETFLSDVSLVYKGWSPEKVGEDFDKIRSNWNTFKTYVSPGRPATTYLGKIGEARTARRLKEIQKEAEYSYADRDGELTKKWADSQPDVIQANKDMLKDGWTKEGKRQAYNTASNNLLVGMGNAIPALVGKRPINLPEGVVADPLAQTIGEGIVQTGAMMAAPAGSALKVAKLTRIKPLVSAAQEIVNISKTGSTASKVLKTGGVRAAENMAIVAPSVIADKPTLEEAANRLAIAGGMGFLGGAAEAGLRAAGPTINQAADTLKSKADKFVARATEDFRKAPDLEVPEVVVKTNPVTDARIAAGEGKTIPITKVASEAVNIPVKSLPPPKVIKRLFNKYLTESKTPLSWRVRERNNIPLTPEEQIAFNQEFGAFLDNEFKYFKSPVFEGDTRLFQDIVSQPMVNPRPDIIPENLEPISSPDAPVIERPSNFNPDTTPIQDINFFSTGPMTKNMNKGKYGDYLKYNAGLTLDNLMEVVEFVKTKSTSNSAKALNKLRAALKTKYDVDLTDGEIQIIKSASDANAAIPALIPTNPGLNLSIRPQATPPVVDSTPPIDAAPPAAPPERLPVGTPSPAMPEGKPFDVNEMRKRYRLERADIIPLKSPRATDELGLSAYHEKATKVIDGADAIKNIDPNAASAAELKAAAEFIANQHDLNLTYNRMVGSHIKSQALEDIFTTVSRQETLTPKQLSTIKSYAQELLNAPDDKIGTRLVVGSKGKQTILDGLLEQIEAWRYNALLGAPSTPVKNVLINSLNMAVDRLFTEPLAGGIDKLIGKGTGVRTRISQGWTGALGKPLEWSKQSGDLFLGAVDDTGNPVLKTAWDRAWGILKEGTSDLAMRARYNLPEINEFGSFIKNDAAKGIVTKLTNLPTRLLMAGDTFARTLIEDNRYRVGLAAVLKSLNPQAKMDDLFDYIMRGSQVSDSTRLGPTGKILGYEKAGLDLFTPEFRASQTNNLSKKLNVDPSIGTKLTNDIGTSNAAARKLYMEDNGIIKKGLSIQEANDAYHVLIDSGQDRLSVGLDMAKEAARKHADDLLLTSAPGQQMEKINGFVNASLGAEAIKPLRAVVPFTNVPTNAVKRGLEYTPLGIFKVIKDAMEIKGAKGTDLYRAQSALSRDLAKTAVGTVGLTGAYLLAHKTANDFLNLTTSGKVKVTPSYEVMTKDDKSLLSTKGIPADSILINGRSYNLDMMGNLGVLLRGVVNADYALRRRDKATAADAVVAAASSVLGQIPYDDLRQLIVNIHSATIAADKGKSFKDLGEKTLTNIVGQYLPNSVKKGRDQFLGGTRTKDSITSDYSGLGKVPEKLLRTGVPKYDVAGETSPRNRNTSNLDPILNFFLPTSKYTDYKDDATFKLLYKAGVGPKWAKAQMSQTLKEIELPEEYLQQVQQDAYTYITENLAEALDSFGGTPEMDTFVAKTIVSDGIKAAKTSAFDKYSMDPRFGKQEEAAAKRLEDFVGN